MYYKAPTQNGTPYYVPIVAKNKEFLIGYLCGIGDGKNLIEDAMKSIKIDLDLGPVDTLLDSTRFNDILENGKRESEMSEKELRKYIYDIVEDITARMDDENSENNIENDNVLEVECTCGIGYYAWRSFEKIPEESFKCTNCGKVLIDYTGHYGYEYEFQEGDTNDRQKN